MEDGALFTGLSRNGSGRSLRPLDLSSLNRIVGRYGLPKVHAIRHAAVAGFYLANDGDIEATRDFAGHANLATTTIYLRGLKNDLRAMAERI